MLTQADFTRSQWRVVQALYQKSCPYALACDIVVSGGYTMRHLTLAMRDAEIALKLAA